MTSRRGTCCGCCRTPLDCQVHPAQVSSCIRHFWKSVDCNAALVIALSLQRPTQDHFPRTSILAQRSNLDALTRPGCCLSCHCVSETIRKRLATIWQHVAHTTLSGEITLYRCSMMVGLEKEGAHHTCISEYQCVLRPRSSTAMRYQKWMHGDAAHST